MIGCLKKKNYSKGLKLDQILGPGNYYFSGIDYFTVLNIIISMILGYGV